MLNFIRKLLSKLYRKLGISAAGESSAFVKSRVSRSSSSFESGGGREKHADRT